MSKARELAELGGVDGALSNRNLLINGGLNVWQRGITFVTGPTNTYTADRWIARDGTISKSADVPAGKGFMNSAYYQNAGVRAGINMRQVIENGYYAIDGQDVTISFWIKTSITTSIAVDLHDAYSSGYILSCPANTWTYQTYTFNNVDTTTFTNFWSGPHAHIDFNFGGSYPDAYITGVQLELGDTATPFEHRSYGDELARCQRYCYRLDGNSSDQTMIGAGFFYGTTATRHIVHFPVTMRGIASVSANGLDVLSDAVNDAAVTLESTLDESIYSCGLNIGGVTATTVGEAAILRLSSYTSAYIEFDAEL